MCSRRAFAVLDSTAGGMATGFWVDGTLACVCLLGGVEERKL